MQRAERKTFRAHRIDKGVKGFIIRTARKHHWRVADWYDLDDLIQDGFVTFCRCDYKYPRANQKQIMALVQVSFINHIHNLANKRTDCLEQLLQSDALLESLAPPQPEESTFETLLGELPQALRQMINRILTEGKPIPYLPSEGRRRETRNEYLSRLAGLDPSSIDIEQTLRSHFATN